MHKLLGTRGTRKPLVTVENTAGSYFSASFKKTGGFFSVSEEKHRDSLREKHF